MKTRWVVTGIAAGAAWCMAFAAPALASPLTPTTPAAPATATPSAGATTTAPAPTATSTPVPTTPPSAATPTAATPTAATSVSTSPRPTAPAASPSAASPRAASPAAASPAVSDPTPSPTPTAAPTVGNPAIDALWQQQGGPTGWLGQPVGNLVPRAGGLVQHFEHGDIAWGASVGAHYLKDPLRVAYTDATDLGLPTSNDYLSATGTTVVDFTNGVIMWSPATGAQAVYGAIFATYARLGRDAGVLGKPTRGEYTTATGARATDFQSGTIIWSPATGAHAVYGNIFNTYNRLGRDASALGKPTRDEFGTASGARASDFEGGTIIWSGATGAHAVYGAIYRTYGALNWDLGVLGKPIRDEFTTASGARASDFEGGTILWSPATGAQAVYGANYRTYGALNWDLGPLGLPTSSEFQGAYDARVNRFQHGLIIWTPWNGSYAVRGAMLDEFARRGYEGGQLGAPISNEYTVSGGWAQDFVGGRIEYSWGSFKVRTLDGRCMFGRVICASKTDLRLRWVVNGHPVLVMDARFGDPYYFTPEGDFQIFSKVRDEWSYLAGVRMPFTMYFYPGGYAVHYSDDFLAVGWNGHSHGCVNTRDWTKIAWLYDQTVLGDRVVVYR